MLTLTKLTVVILSQYMYVKSLYDIRTLKLYRAVCQLYLKKTVGKKRSLKKNFFFWMKPKESLPDELCIKGETYVW